MDWLRIIRGTIVKLLVALFICYYASSAFFTHSHYIDGKCVTHSHPYSSSSHTHTAQVLTLLEVLNATPFLLIVVVVALALLSESAYSYRLFSPKADNAPLRVCINLRGPPTTSI